jgi:type VII secretion-associated serine protease mycosin
MRSRTGACLNGLRWAILGACSRVAWLAQDAQLPASMCHPRPRGRLTPVSHRTERHRRPLPGRRAYTILAVLAGAWSSLAAPAAASGTAQTYVAVVEGHDGDLTVNTFRAATHQQMTDRVEKLSRDGAVVDLDLNRPVRALGSTDPYRAKQWALDTTSFEATWPLTNGTGAVVAVVDTGVQADHEDLTGTVLTGWDAIANRSGATADPNGHGTHVAGIIAAAAGNGKGIAGAAPGVRILPVRVLPANGSGTVADVLEGIIWAADHGADVINLSLGGGGNDRTYAAAIRYALDKGALVVAAAGNEALEGNPPSYPGADPGAIAVAATTMSGTRASFSNYGSYVDLAAPGSAIYSTIPSGYASWSGTSMATPYVSAAAALLAARHPGLSSGQVRDLLERSAHDLGAPGRDDTFGAGLVDPAKALSLAEPPPVSPPPPEAAPPPVSPDPAPVSPRPEPPASPSPNGYWVVAADGQVQAFGSAPDLGDASHRPVGAPIVAAAATSSGRGYWLAASDGAVLPFGDAISYGSAQHLHLNAPIVGMAPSASGNGYWLLGQDGGVFSFGDAGFYGSTGNIKLNQPVVDIAATPSGRGYWFVATDGGVFSFGDARFYGSTGGMTLNQPVVSLTPSVHGGYWLVAADGGIFAFDTPFHGSLPGLARPQLPHGRRIRATAAGAGYYILGSNGQTFPFGAAADHGSTTHLPAVDLILAP